MAKKIIKIKGNETELSEMTRMPAEIIGKYAYMFELGFEHKNMKFWGFVPDEAFLKHIADTIEKLGVENDNINIVLACSDKYAEIAGGGKSPVESALDKGEYIGTKDDAEKFKNALHESKRWLASHTSDTFYPSYACKDKRANVFVNIDSPDAREGFVEGLLHHLTEKEGYLKTALNAHKRAEDAFLSTNIEHEILEAIRLGVGDLLAYGIGVQKSCKDFVAKTATDFSETVYNDNIKAGVFSDSKKIQMGSFMLAVNIASHTLPSNYPFRDAFRKSKIEQGLEKIMPNLHENVQKEFPNIYSAFWDFEFPPTEKSVFACYKKVFESYFRLPEGEMEWNKNN